MTPAHPNDAANFYLPTPMTAKLHRQLSTCVLSGRTGGLIVGPSGVGKSHAIKGLGPKLLMPDDDRIWVKTVSYSDQDKTTMRVVYAKLARQFDYDVKNRDSGEKLASLICHRLADLSQSNPLRRIVMVVDEAQFLTLQQLDAFATIYNELMRHGTNLVTFFVVNEERLGTLEAELERPENTYIRLRFFEEKFVMGGIRNAKDLSASLGSYDDYVLDEEAGITATEFFLPDSYKKGFRLASLGPIYWQIFEHYYGRPLKLHGLRMRHFIAVSNILLTKILPEINPHANPALLNAAILRSLEAHSIG